MVNPVFSIIGLDILPVGKSMTTRPPLHLELIQSVMESRVGKLFSLHFNILVLIYYII